ncbi:hypothetical protein GQ43DRAFT_434799 [Delitschia confertaspora ATCC 74209]|uniref:alpha-galactosidase n=1 Tax=Delitschia confertaspora ATCC 74209 TaxID=1513339 RepID=A0A9P4JEU8_9PLEO|nr:hypothetical protein GQ43DRAFT_434799 [Delitschia confertaspora ATCC 74209]
MTPLSTALMLIGTAGLASAFPANFAFRDVITFDAGSSWDILLDKNDKGVNINAAKNARFQVIDIDLFDTDNGTIADLKQDKKVICYFSAGSREDWRPDAEDFKSGDYKTPLDGWPGEHWVDIKSENVRNIMKKRIKDAAEKGCQAVDPDNVDGYNGNQDKFGYQPADYASYIRELAAEAKKYNLALGLKNAIEIIPQVADVIQFGVNEQCHVYNECDQYKPLTDRNLAVFNIEYGNTDCSSPPGVKLSIVVKPEDQSLSTLGSGACSGSNQGAPDSSDKTGNAPTSTRTSQPTPTAPSPTTPVLEPTSTPSASPETPDENENGNDKDEDDDGPFYLGWRGRPYSSKSHHHGSGNDDE